MEKIKQSVIDRLSSLSVFQKAALAEKMISPHTGEPVSHPDTFKRWIDENHHSLIFPHNRRQIKKYLKIRSSIIEHVAEQTNTTN